MVLWNIISYCSLQLDAGVLTLTVESVVCASCMNSPFVDCLRSVRVDMNVVKITVEVLKLLLMI